MPSLMFLLIGPFIAASMVMCIPRRSGRLLKRLAVGLSCFPLCLLLYGQGEWLGSALRQPWLPAVSIELYLQVDPLSLVFLYLVALLVPLSLLPVRAERLASPHLFYGLVLLLQGLLIGFFTARDLALFVFFFEAILLPLYFILSLWGGPKRQVAANTFLLYMIAGSTLMIAAVLALYFSPAGTFDLDKLAQWNLQAPPAPLLFGAFMLAFAVKTPLFPFHAWLPEAYTQACPTGTLLLSALLSKAGIYGFLRLVLELFPREMQAWSWLLLALAIVGVLYGALAASQQVDFKRVIAYSSFSHVNFILVGLFTLSAAGELGAILQSINHAVTISALFLVVCWLERRLHSTAFEAAGGLAKMMPHLCWLTLFFVAAAVALPGTSPFVGEVLVFYGLFGRSFLLTVLLGLSLIFSVVYLLRFMKKIYFASPQMRKGACQDLQAQEVAIALPLVALILWLGIYPLPVIKHLEPTIDKHSEIAKGEWAP